MALEDSTIILEIENIFVNGGALPDTVWECFIITPKHKFRPVKLKSIDIVRSYDTNWTDYIQLEIVVPLGALTFDIKPHKQELYLELVRSMVGERENLTDVKLDYVKFYKIILREEQDDILESISRNLNAPEVADLSALVDLNVQLLPVNVEKVRLYELGGIFRDSKPADVLRYLLTDVSSKLKLPLEDNVVGVDMVKADNEKPNNHVIVPHGTRPQDLASQIQKDTGGIYNSGIGCYLQDQLWYIWPLYNFTRYDKEERTLFILNVPPNKFPGVEKTWILNGKKLVVMSTGQAKHIDRSNQLQLNQGNGIKLTHAHRVWEGLGETNFNKCIVDRSQNNSEFFSIERKGYNYAPYSKDRISDNVFEQVSKIAPLKGSFLSLVWENSIPEYIYPGMPTKIAFIQEDEIVEVFGVVYQTEHYIHDLSPGPTIGKQVTNTNILMFISPRESEE